MTVGKTTAEMATYKKGDNILDLCGPLGQPTHIEKVGRVILVGGGFGVAPLYPIARAFKAHEDESGRRRPVCPEKVLNFRFPLML